MISKSTVKELRQYIIKGEIQKALDNLSKSCEDNEDLMSEILLLNYQYARISKQSRLGIIGANEVDVTISRISYSIIELIQKIDNESEVQTESIYTLKKIKY